MDSSLPDPRRKRRQDDDAIFKSFLLTVGFQSDILRRLDDSPASLEERLAAAHELGVANGVLPSGVPSAALLSLFNLYLSHVRAVETYTPPITGLTVHLWSARERLFLDGRSEESGARDTRSRKPQMVTSWKAHAAQVLAGTLPGNHLTLLREPHVHVLADELSAVCLDRLTATATIPSASVACRSHTVWIVPRRPVVLILLAPSA